MQAAFRWLLLGFGAWGFATGAWGAANDNFGNGSELGSVVAAVIPFDGRGATRQVGEPSHESNSSTGSLWWRWTAPSSGQLWLKISYGGADSSGIRAVYTGADLSGLTKVTATSYGAARVFAVTAGTVYQIAVADNRAAQLGFEFFPLPANDAFENRTVLGSPADCVIEGATVGATLQPGEPSVSYQGPTIWWSWQAPADGLVSFDLVGTSGNSWNVGVYTGATLAGLVQRARRWSSMAVATPTLLRVKAGESFAVVASVDGTGGVGRVRLNWHLAPMPYQATAVDAVDLGSVVSATGSADNRGEPVPPETTYSRLWWRWTPPANGIVKWEGTGSPSAIAELFDANLQPLAYHEVTKGYRCRAGQPCLLSLKTAASSAGILSYQLTFGSGGANDDVAGAAPLVMGDTAVDLTFSGVEPGEPTLANTSWGRSRWWEWTAPADGALWLDMTSNWMTLGVWGVAPVKPGVKKPYGYSQMMVAAKAGETLRIGVLESDSFASVPAPLTARFLPATTGNDAFANAADMGSELTVTGSGDPTGASREAGEPTPEYAGGSRWWKWTAPQACQVRPQTRSDAFGGAGASRLYIYRGAGWGSLAAMTGTAVAAGETLWLAVTAPTGQPAVPRAFELSAVPNHANDAFANATDLGGVTVWQASFYLDATSEPGEPRAQPSLWWKWTAPVAGNAFFSTTGASAVGSVYQGSALANLSLVADTASTGKGRFMAQAGATYWLAVSGSDATAKARVDWRLEPPPPGDWFAAPVELGQATALALSPAVGAGIEAIEAGLFEAGYNETLWWRWTAPADGRMVAKSLYASTWKLFEETGGAGAGLTPVTNEQVLAGRPYRIANIGGGYHSTAAATWQFHPTPANDPYSSAIDLGNVTAITTQADLYAATVDATELALFAPPTNPPTHGVWWRWTAPFDGVLKSQAAVSSKNLSEVSLRVLKGNDPVTWQQVAGSTSSSFGTTECLASVKAGGTYLILLAARVVAPELATLTLSAWPAPANNEWVDATDLGSVPAAVATGSNVGASREPFEGTSGSGSVWWKWTAPTAGNAFVTASVASTAPSLVVYQPSGAVLVPVVGSEISYGRAFRAAPGQTYWISVAGAGSTTEGEVGVTLRLTEIPANDDFANRIVLGPDLPVAFSGTTTTSTVEPGEVTYDSGTGLTRSSSRWWSWTAPFTGAVRAEIAGSGYIHVQTGDTVNTLTTLVRMAGAGNFAWVATAGVTYHIAVFHTAQWGGAFTCQLFPMTQAANDSFAARTSLGSVTDGQWDLNTLQCTAETGEPAHGGQAATSSVWFEWTAPAAGGYLLEGVVGGYQARVGIYQGSAVNGLQNVAGGSWRVAFIAVAGQTYLIAVDGRAGLGQLTLKPQPLPPNDLFANRILLPATIPPIKGSTMLAGMETGEPRTSTSNPLRTLWWEWVAPNFSFGSSGITIQEVSGSYAQIEVYSSPGVATGFSSLSYVTSAGSSGSFSATTGQRYYFKVFIASSSSSGTDFDFRLGSSSSTSPALPPPNDDFANRADLGSTLGRKITGDLYGATRESWETVSSSQVTLWWSWTAPGDGFFGLLRSGSQPVTMAIFTGTNTAALTPVASGIGRTEWFRATAGTVYQIRCATSSVSNSSSNRLIGLELMAGAAPGNDHFAASVSLPEPGTTSVECFNAGATAETAEPAHAGTTARASVWYQWTATVAGPIQIAATSATLRTGVYQGAEMAALTQVASGNTPLTFTAALGETYRIALDAAGDESFSVRLNLPAAVGTNDAFAAATELVGALVEVPGSTAGATLEPDEPYHTGSSSQGGSRWWH